MDFRTADPAAVTFAKGGPGGAVRARPALTIQTPRAPCRVTPSGSFLRIDLAARGEFAEFVAAAEAAAAASEGDWRGARSCSYAGSGLRLTAFADSCQFFGPDGEFVEWTEAPGRAASLPEASCIVQLQGAWTTDARWGLRWKVLQVKMYPASAPGPPGAGDDDEPRSPPRKKAAYAFLD